MTLWKFLGLGDDARSDQGDSETVRRISGQLERLAPEQAKFLASFAYVLARLAHADLDFNPAETAEMERSVQQLANLTESEAALVVQIAQSQARLLGGTENYVVTREFKTISTKAQRGQLLRCLYAVAASDGTIAVNESAEIVSIGEELGLTRAEINSLRGEYRDKLAEFQKA